MNPPNENINPYQSPSSPSEHPVAALPESDAEISLAATFGDQNYVLRGYSDRLQVLDDQGKVFELPRQTLFAKLIHGTIIRNSFRAKLDKTYVFKFSKEDYKTLKNWIGRPTYADLRETLAAGRWWPLPVALVFLVPTLSEQFSLSKILSLTIGVLLIAQFAAIRIKPHRSIFLLSAVIFALIAVLNGQRIVSAYVRDGDLSVFLVILTLVLCNFSLSWLRKFFAYGSMEPNTANR